MPGPTGPIAQAIAEGFKLLNTLQQTSRVRRMRKAVDAAEKYIQVNQGDSPFDHIKPENRKDKLRYYAKRFFKYNN